MATEIRLPVLGENVESATVVKLLVKPGDTIARDQPIMELETEKASVDLPAPTAGTAKEITATISGNILVFINLLL